MGATAEVRGGELSAENRATWTIGNASTGWLAWLGWLGFVVIALGVAAFSVNAAYRYGIATANGADPWQQGVLFAISDVFKFAAFIISPFLWGRSRVLASGAFGVGLLLCGLSIWAVLSSELIDRAALASTSSQIEKGVGQRERDIGRLEAALAGVKALRPAAMVDAEISALRRDRRFTNTAGCTDATASASREFCIGHDRLIAELAGGQQAAEIRRQIDVLRRDQRQEGAVKVASPELAMLAKFTGMPVDEIGVWRALALAVVIELAGAIGMAAIEPLRPSGRNTQRKAEGLHSVATEHALPSSPMALPSTSSGAPSAEPLKIDASECAQEPANTGDRKASSTKPEDPSEAPASEGPEGLPVPQPTAVAGTQQPEDTALIAVRHFIGLLDR